MKVKLMLILSALGMIILSSCAYEQSKISSSKIYIADEQHSVEISDLKKPNTFVVLGEKPGFSAEEMQKRNELSKIRALREFEDEQEEFYYESTYKNIRRIIGDEMIVGYVRELDNPDFKGSE